MKKNLIWKLLPLSLISIPIIPILVSCTKTNQNQQSENLKIGLKDIDLVFKEKDETKEKEDNKSILLNYMIDYKHEIDATYFELVDQLIIFIDHLNEDLYENIKQLMRELRHLTYIKRHDYSNYWWFHQLDVHMQLESDLKRFISLIKSFHNKDKINVMINDLLQQTKKIENLFDLYQKKWINRFSDYLILYQHHLVALNTIENEEYIKKFESVIKKEDDDNLKSSIYFENMINWFYNNTQKNLRFSIDDLGILKRWKEFEQIKGLSQYHVDDKYINHDTKSELIYKYLLHLNHLFDSGSQFNFQTLTRKNKEEILTTLKQIEDVVHTNMSFKYFFDHNATWKQLNHSWNMFGIYDYIKKDLENHDLINEWNQTSIKPIIDKKENYSIIRQEENNIQQGVVVYHDIELFNNNDLWLDVTFNNNETIRLNPNDKNQKKDYMIVVSDFNHLIKSFNPNNRLFKIEYQTKQVLLSKTNRLVIELLVNVNDITYRFYVYNRSWFDQYQGIIDRIQNYNPYLFNQFKNLFSLLNQSFFDTNMIFKYYHSYLRLYIDYLRTNNDYVTYEYLDPDLNIKPYYYNIEMIKSIHKTINQIHELKLKIKDHDVLDKIIILTNEYQKLIKTKYKSSQDLIDFSIKSLSLLSVIELIIDPLNKKEKNPVIVN